MLYIVYINEEELIKVKIDDEEWRERDDLMYKCVQKFCAYITKESDDVLRRAIYDYAREKSLEQGEDIQVIFADQEKVDRILDLGIKEYLRLEREERWREKE